MSSILMPKATAVWLIDNTRMTFEQISAFCGLHILEVNGIADGDVAAGIRGADPIANGQLIRSEIEKAENDPAYNMVAITFDHTPIESTKKKKRRGPRYTPLSKRQDRPAETGTAAGFNNRKIELGFLRAVAAYEVQPWAGPVTLYRPVLDRHWQVSGRQWVSREREYVYPDNDWTRHAPALEVHEVPGDHDGMVLAPNVSVLGKAIRDQLAKTARQPDTAKAAE